MNNNNPAAVLFDENGNAVSSMDDGGQRVVYVRDQDTVMLLQEILIQLKMMNFHLMNITDIPLGEDDTTTEN